MGRRHSRQPTALLAVAVIALGAFGAPPAPAPFNRARWLSDYDALKAGLERSYSHLAWFGSPEGGVDVPALDRQTLRALRRATTDAEATAALTAFVDGFHDGHLVRRPSAPVPNTVPEPPRPTSYADGKSACAAYGYAPSGRVPFSLPFETLAGFSLSNDGLSDAFRAGVIDSGGVKLGLVRIQRFRAGEFAPLCVQAWTALRSKDGGTSSEDVGRAIDSVWLETLAQRLARFRQQRVDAVVVDLGGNSGGNDLGDWAVREFTSQAVRSVQLLVAHSDAGTPYLDTQVRSLRAGLGVPDLPEATRVALEQSLTRFERTRALAAGPACPMSWVWRERRGWGTSPCTRLVEAGFFSGPYDYVDAGTFDARSAPVLYWATAADAVRGAWDGKTFVLTNEQTGSAAEGFTALMRDRGIAKTVGVRTLGAGCGFMNDVEPLVLPQSRLAFSVPNCVRLRSDGTDDVAGVAPDLPVLPLPGESPRARAARVVDTLARALVESR